MSKKTNDEKSPKVYVVQSTSRLSLAKAHQFGELVELLPENRQITLSPQPVLRELRTKLKNFTDDDFILLIGDPIAIALAVFIAGEVNTGRVRVLKWDRQMNNYYQLKIDLYDRMR